MKQTANASEAATKLLFIRTDRLGETLLNLPAVAALKTAFPQSSVTFLAHPDLVTLLSAAPGVDAVMECPRTPPRPWWRQAIRLAKQLRHGRFQIAVVSNPKKELHLAVFLAGIPVRIGYARKWAWTLTHRVTDNKALGEHHEVEYNLNLLKALGISASSTPSYQLPVSGEARQEISQFLSRLSVGETDRLVAIHPWTSNPKKQWPVERFRALITRLAQLTGVKPVVIGGQEERAREAALMRGRSHQALSLVGRLSLTELAALLQKVRVLVSNDSGPMHLAAAVGTPVVALFGTDDPATGPPRWGPWGSGHTVIWKPTMDAIELEEVWQAVQRYLS